MNLLPKAPQPLFRNPRLRFEADIPTFSSSARDGLVPRLSEWPALTDPTELLYPLLERIGAELSLRIALRIEHQHAIRRIRSACCARTASSHAAATPPRSVMRSRRLI